MCGIAGVARHGDRPVTPALLRRMAASIHHRGPDGFGYYCGSRAGLAHVRLSIVDLAGGAQPLANEDGTLLVTYNGEVYNHLELRRELERFGHHFRTRCDTEVLVHAFEQWGPAMLHRLNGQFAFALYDRRDHSVFLARDRFGVRPLIYTMQRGDLYFASEAKALFATAEVEPVVDLTGLDEVFTLWAARAPRTVFRGVRSLEPGSYARWHDGALRTSRYYELSFPELPDEPADALEHLDELLRDSVRLRLRADVPVGGYLSGGLDSSITCALAGAASPYTLRTFSVTFDDPQLDESAHQLAVARDLHSDHHAQPIRQSEIADVFPNVIWHVETPVLRTAPAPMYLLSRLARDNGIKVVLTGEGSDELFLGYDLFKETAVRHFCLRQPASSVRPRLFDRLYPYLSSSRGGELWRRFFLNAGPSDDPLFSHLPRVQLASWAKGFFSAEVRSALGADDPLQSLRDALPDDFSRWSALNRAAYLEMKTLLASYLLSAQGDRVALAHGVEGRFPFLDHRLFELAAALPTRSKLCGLREKEILRRWARNVVPASVRERTKQPYRAPDIPAFFGSGMPDYVAEALDAPAVSRAGLFDPPAVEALVARCRSGRATSVRESQGLVGILSAQLWHEQFFVRPTFPVVTRHPDVALDESVDDHLLNPVLVEAR